MNKQAYRDLKDEIERLKRDNRFLGFFVCSLMISDIGLISYIKVGLGL